MSYIDKVIAANLVHVPRELKGKVHYETVMGSHAYGVEGNESDLDIYGFCIPPLDMIFPHLKGEIPGFGNQIQRFNQWQQHHVKMDGKSLDFNIYSIISYFQLCMDGNPNMIDSLFTPPNCATKLTAIANYVKENRRLFLSKKTWHTFKGFAYSQLHKMQNKSPEGKRQDLIEKYGYDVKFAYHLVRLMLEVEQILTEGDLDLRQNSKVIASVKRGEWEIDAVKAFFNDKEKALESVYLNSTIPHKPDQDKIKQVLLNCLEMQYGDLEHCVKVPEKSDKVLEEITKILKDNNYV